MYLTRLDHIQIVADGKDKDNLQSRLAYFWTTTPEVLLLEYDDHNKKAIITIEYHDREKVMKKIKTNLFHDFEE